MLTKVSSKSATFQKIYFDIVQYTFMYPILLARVNPAVFDEPEDVFHQSFVLRIMTYLKMYEYLTRTTSNLKKMSKRASHPLKHISTPNQ